MKLQACTKCGAQFDVSSFAPGQKFSCGSCGAVLTAHVGAKPPGATPARPAVSGRAPGSRAPGAPAAGPAAGGRPPQGRKPGAASRGDPAKPARGARRGPQYRPPERRQEAQKTPAAGRSPAGRPGRGGRAARPDGRGRGAPARSGGPVKNPAVIYGVGALVVAAVLLFLVVGVGGRDKSDGGNGATATKGGSSTATTGTSGQGTPNQPPPVKEPDTVASINAEMRGASLDTANVVKGFAKRLAVLGTPDGKAAARKLYENLIKNLDPDDVDARKFLGYTDFHTDILGRKLESWEEPIPDTIANRKGYPFLDAVMEFHNRRRWLTDEDEIELAKKAVAEMTAHEKNLKDDHTYRAGDRIRANIATDPLLKNLNYLTHWKAPYLVCYSSNETLSEFDLLKEPDKKKRKKMREDMRRKRKDWEDTLNEKAAIYFGLYEEWMKRFAETFEFKNLTDEFGGRPDYKPGVRSFPDGVPLVIWIFTDGDAFRKYHKEVKKEELPPGVAGYFTPQTGWIFLFDEKGDDPSERMFEINKNVHEGTHQLEYWFTRQKSKWGRPKPSQDAFSEGIAEFLGSVQMDKARKLKFVEVNVPRLRNMKRVAEQMKKQGRDYPVFPAERLSWFNSYGAVMNWGSGEWGLNPGFVLSLFYQQSWAFTYFLNHFENGKYREKWLEYFDAVLHRETGLTMNQPVFKRVFKIRDEDDWEELEEDWQGYFKDVIMKMDADKYAYKPPKRDDWE